MPIMLMRVAGKVSHSLTQAFREVLAVSGRERAYLSNELEQFRGLMPLLARTGARQSLSEVERAALRAHLRRATSLSPYLVVTLLPGALVLLPVLLWWRDRRRNRDLRVLACTTGKAAT